MADRPVEERVSHLEERAHNAEFALRELGENTRSQLDALCHEMSVLRQEVYRALDAIGVQIDAFDKNRKSDRNGILAFMTLGFTTLGVLIALLALFLAS